MKILALILLVVVAVGTVLWIKTQPFTSGGIRKTLAKEFQKEYPEKIESTGETKIVKLDARVRTLQVGNRPLSLWTYTNENTPPLIKLKYGQKVRVEITNNLSEDTTLHFHGVRVPNSQDGVSGVTQEPIKPGQTYTYEFTPKDSGTYWFHSHVNSSEQIERGLYGAFVVEDKDPEQYSKDIVWIVDDWKLSDQGEIDPLFNTRGNLSHDGRWGNLITVNRKLQEQIQASVGERIRLRLINASNGRTYKLNFLDLPIQVIAIDGTRVSSEIDLSSIDFAPGNRIDLDIHVPEVQGSRQYQLMDTYTQTPYTLGTLLVSGDNAKLADFKSRKGKSLEIWSKASSLEIDKEYVMNAVRGGKFGISWTLNGKSYEDHETLNLTKGKFYKLRFTNKSFRLHPMHLHGQFFKVISRNNLPVDDGSFRDTILVKGQETVDIGVVPLETGEWMLHCHILEHSESGMMTMINIQE